MIRSPRFAHGRQVGGQGSGLHRAAPRHFAGRGQVGEKLHLSQVCHGHRFLVDGQYPLVSARSSTTLDCILIVVPQPHHDAAGEA